MRKIGLFLGIAALAACERVDETEHCVETRYGNVTQEKAKEGLNAAILVDYTCFKLTEQNYPGGANAKEVIDNAPTKDSTLIAGDVAMTWQYDPTTVFAVFKAKRNPDAVLFEIQNALRDGFRSAVATQTTENLLGPQRAVFDSVVKIHVQRKLGAIARVNKIFIRGIVLPKALTAARERIVKQAADLREAQNKKEIAEANAAEKIAESRGEAESKLILAKSEAESKRLLAASYAQSPKIVELEIAKAYSQICGEADTCILGASALDKFLAGTAGKP